MSSPVRAGRPTAKPAARAASKSKAKPKAAPESSEALRTASLAMISIGYGNLVAGHRVVSIVSAGSSPMRRLREQAAAQGKLIDATEGRRTRSIIVTDSDHVILSAINPETIATRLTPGAGES